ncbi:phage tail protein [Chromobacterium sp. S0633]|uniref:phage tail protein n=1 Tax=Chromobacterium sp. S0633 TaxID=2957805 RepID=UPI00209FB7A4|nr:phage tail protein [Chromobacterium sp. S0633]MCP1293309.1 phage tail protein [Chromobacterium sp. S0633]
MATSTEQIATAYPTPTHRYHISIGNDEMAFTAVSGMEISHETIAYKDGLSGLFYMPDQIAPVNISLLTRRDQGEKLTRRLNSLHLSQPSGEIKISSSASPTKLATNC